MSKRKSPAFSFYPDSWFGGTGLMPPAQRAAYIDLMGLQWLSGGFSREEAKLFVRGVTHEDIDAVIDSKFTEQESGRFLNPRLEEERSKQQKTSETNSQNGKKGGRPKGSKKRKESEEETESQSESKSQAKAIKNPSVSVSDSVSVLVSDSVSDSESESAHPLLENPEFVSCWERWKSICREQHHHVVGETLEETLLLDVSRCSESIEDAIALVQFTSLKGAKHLILNGDHRRQGESEPKRGAKMTPAELMRATDL